MDKLHLMCVMREHVPLHFMFVTHAATCSLTVTCSHSATCSLTVTCSHSDHALPLMIMHLFHISSMLMPTCYICSITHDTPHASNLLHVLVHVMFIHSTCSCDSARLVCYSHHACQLHPNALKLDGLKVSCRDHSSKNAPHARIPGVQNENHVLVEVVEATAMMHHTQLALQDVYNHHCRYVEMASHLHITVH